MAGRKPKTTHAQWLEAGQRMLVGEGVAGLKVERLANRLGVSRGGFYHCFKDRDEFLHRLVRHWEETCRFLPDGSPPLKPAEAGAWFDWATDLLIEGGSYDYRFDLAVREWGRADRRVQWAVERADRERIEFLRRCFEAIGYDAGDASIRARIYYYHQIGSFAIGIQRDMPKRRQRAKDCSEILCGGRDQIL